MSREGKEKKTAQLQIRVSAKEKASIANAAARAGMDASEYVLSKVLSEQQEKFQSLVYELNQGGETSYSFAALHDFLFRLAREEFSLAVTQPPRVKLSLQAANYLAAMIEQAAYKMNGTVPQWVREIPPLQEPFFGTELKNLRLHLLLSSPLAFRRRNIFIDASIGDRV